MPAARRFAYRRWSDLQLMNRQCLVVSTIAVGIGLFSGVIMNLNRWGFVAWGEGGVILSGVLFVWLLVATGFEFFLQTRSPRPEDCLLDIGKLWFLGTDHDWRFFRATTGASRCYRRRSVSHSIFWVTHREAANDRLQPPERRSRLPRTIVIHHGSSPCGDRRIPQTIFRLRKWCC